MNNDNKLILSEVIYYSLFKKILLEPQILTNILPKNTFGVFTTIRRNNKLSVWPEDIHGCIGYWDHNYNTISTTTLYSQLLKVSHDAMWNDNRSNNFSPIETDPLSYIEIDFMLYPKYDIDPNNGKIIKLNKLYNNDEYGLIVQDKNTNSTSRATYLPKVFSGISWQNIVSSIKNKANIIDNNISFYAYKIEQIKCRFTDILTYGIFREINIKHFTRFLLSNARFSYKYKYPFPYAVKKDNIIFDNNQEVRNIGSIGSVITYSSLYPELMDEKIKKNIEETVMKILKNIVSYSAQGLAFLAPVFTFYKSIEFAHNTYCERLIDKLPEAERDFEFPEIIIALNKAGCGLDKTHFVTDELIRQLQFNNTDVIFRMNWVIQAMISLKHIPSNNLIDIFLGKIENITNFETNELAVSFEALCFIFKYTKYDKTKILSKMFEIWYMLETRKDKFMLYKFIKDDEARIDISEHVNNGLAVL